MTDMSPEIAVGEFDDEPGLDLAVLLAPVIARWKTIAIAAFVCGCAAYAASYLITPRYTASSVFMPPQSQGSAAGALASLGALSSLVGGTAPKSSPDQYVALMESATVSNRIIQKFGLKKLYESKFDSDARTALAASVKITVGKKDSLITVEATDTDRARAAAIANQYVVELRRMTNDLAVTEAQQRRVFFEQLLQKTRDQLATAQIALEASGYSAGALNVEPKSAADSYAHLRAELTAAQVKLDVMRGSLADTAPQFQSQRDTVAALSAQVAKLEAQDDGHPKGGDYINRYREFKYQETLFDLFARQYETARVDESREGALIQVVDPATPPERKSGPRHTLFGLGGAAFGFVLSCLIFGVRGHRRRQAQAV